MDLDSLMLFYEVIRAGSLTAAGIKLQLAKSTISRRLARLEQHLGCILVKKSARKLTLTEVGTLLYQRCTNIAAELHDASQEVRTLHSGMQGTLRLTVPADFGVTWLARLIDDFVRLFPEITITIRLHNNDFIDLLKEPFDIAIQVGEIKPSQMVCKQLAIVPRGIYASPEYLARRGTPHSLEDCAKHDWIVTEVEQREGLWLSRRRSKRQAIRVTNKLVVNSARLGRELGIMGLGIVLIPDIFCTEAVQNQRLVRILIPWQSPPLRIAAFFLSRDRIPQKARAFLDFFADRARSTNWQL
jgi:DNA-binding transcriptional LysR family regulator